MDELGNIVISLEERTGMGFSNDWDTSYSNNTHFSIWPWSDLISKVMRFAKPGQSANLKVLELGCGAGANIPFFKSLGCEYYGIDGSEFIIDHLRTKFPDLINNLQCVDFISDFYFNRSFDLIVDRASVTHNSTESIISCLQQVNKSLKVGGKFIGIDWFSTEHSDYKLNSDSVDKFTKCNFSKGQFYGVGNVHFSDKEHLIELFKRFKLVQLEHKTVRTEIPDSDHTSASWNLVAEKI